MPVVNVSAPGHLDPYDSYGLISCNLISQLHEMGAAINALALGNREMPGQSEAVQAIVRQPMQPASGGILLGYPTSYARMHPATHTGARVAVTMFESTRIPADWVEPLNACDAVVVPSRFLVEVIRKSGVTAPIHVMPLGVSETFQYYQRPERETITFLAFADRGMRKGGHVAEQAFLRAFGADTRYKLILKMRDARYSTRGQRIEVINENIELIQQDMTEAELYELYKSVDVLVNPNRGEGFGLIPREAAATGCIVMATDWGGTADDIDHWGICLPYKLVDADWRGAKRFEGQNLGQWAEPDIAGVAERMQNVARYFRIHRSRTRFASRFVTRHYSWKAFALRVYRIWREIHDGGDGRTNRTATA